MGKFNRPSRKRKPTPPLAKPGKETPQMATVHVTVPTETLHKQAKEVIAEKKAQNPTLRIGAFKKTEKGAVFGIDPAEAGKDETVKTFFINNEPRFMSWSVEGVWNQSIGRPDRPIEPRSHLYASELGKAPVDLFLALKGVQPSNPPNMRSTRKFEAGDIWEWILELVLRRAGLLVSSQKHIMRCYPGLLEVTGRLDKIAGGKPDWEKAKYEIENEFLPEFIKVKAESIITDLSKKFPLGVKEIVVEIKSCSSFMFEVYDRLKMPSDNHELQAWHYLKDHDEAHVFYVCRDDVRVLELPVYADDRRIEGMYKSHIEKITKYWKSGKQPELEKPIIFDPMLFKFKDNWKIKYSNYLTMLYGYKNQKEYEDQFRPMSARFNRVITRIAEGKEMTANNKEAIKEMKIHYPNFEKHIPEIKKHKEEILAEPDVIENGTI